ncbi:hypothetical protein pb186bvf_005802 [Paramecium bursaria]
MIDKKHQLEETKYSIQINFEVLDLVYQTLISKKNKHQGDLELLRKFIQNIPYLKQITSKMTNRYQDRVIQKLQITQCNKNIDNDDFNIILNGEVEFEGKFLVQSDTFQGKAKIIRETQILFIDNHSYQEFISEYHDKNLIEEKLQFLQTISILGKMSVKRIKNSIDNFKEGNYQVGSIIYKEGQTSDNIYIIKQGEVILVKDVQLQLCTQKCIFGELELVEQSNTRQHKAQVTQQLEFYSISIILFKVMLVQSNLYEQFCAEFQHKKMFWNERIKKNKKQVEEKIDYSEFKNTIPRTYHNYVPSYKMKGKRQSEDLDAQLREERKNKQYDLEKHFQQQIKHNFKTNYNLRRVIIQSRQQNYNIPLFKELKLEQYLPPKHVKHFRMKKLISEFNQSENRDFMQFVNDVQSNNNIKLESRTVSTATMSKARLTSPTHAMEPIIIQDKERRPRTANATTQTKRPLRVQSQIVDSNYD